MRDLKSELEVKEAKHFKRKAGDVFEGEGNSTYCHGDCAALRMIVATG